MLPRLVLEERQERRPGSTGVLGRGATEAQRHLERYMMLARERGEVLGALHQAIVRGDSRLSPTWRYRPGGCEDARSGAATGAYAGGATEVIAQAGAGGGAGTAVSDT